MTGAPPTGRRRIFQGAAGPRIRPSGRWRSMRDSRETETNARRLSGEDNRRSALKPHWGRVTPAWAQPRITAGDSTHSSQRLAKC